MANAKTPIVVAKPDVPVDPHGITTNMKREIARAVGRVGHKADKQEVLIGTLKGFIKYAEARHKDAIVREKIMAEKRRAKSEEQSQLGLNAAAVAVEQKRRAAEQLLAAADRIEGKIK